MHYKIFFLNNLLYSTKYRLIPDSIFGIISNFSSNFCDSLACKEASLLSRSLCLCLLWLSDRSFSQWLGKEEQWLSLAWGCSLPSISSSHFGHQTTGSPQLFMLGYFNYVSERLIVTREKIRPSKMSGIPLHYFCPNVIFPPTTLYILFSQMLTL